MLLDLLGLSRAVGEASSGKLSRKLGRVWQTDHGQTQRRNTVTWNVVIH